MEIYKPGTMLDDRYEVMAFPMMGGMGVVYLCLDIALEQPVAIKTLNPAMLSNNDAVSRFLIESQTWIQLERHAHIVQAKATFLIGAQPFIVTEFVDGGKERTDASLRSLLVPNLGLGIEMSLGLGIEKSLDLSLQFCEGAQYAYRKLRLIHRDIKPENLLVTKEGVLKISDFGLSKFSDESKKSSPMGTPIYMPPEQWEDANLATVQSDIYSFGIVLYEMITGKRPFNGNTLKELQKSHLEDPVPSIRKIKPDIPEEIDSIIQKCLDKNPLKRFHYYEDLAEQLRQFYQMYVGVNYQPHEDEMDMNTEYSQAELLNNGDSLFVIGKYQEALRYYDRLLDLNPNSGTFWYRKSTALSKLGKDHEAVLYLSKAVELEPSNLDAAKEYIRCLIRLERKDDALTYCRQVLSVNTSDRDLLKLKKELLHREIISQYANDLIAKQGDGSRKLDVSSDPNIWGKFDEPPTSIFPTDKG